MIWVYVWLSWPVLLPFGIFCGILPLLKLLFLLLANEPLICCWGFLLTIDVLWAAVGMPLINPSAPIPVLQNASGHSFGLVLFDWSVHVITSFMCANIEELVACGSYDLNKSMRTLALLMATSVSSVSSSWLSIFAGSASLKCSKPCSSDIHIILPRTIRSYANCFLSHLVWSNLMFCQYVHCCHKVCPHEVNLSN